MGTSNFSKGWCLRELMCCMHVKQNISYLLLLDICLQEVNMKKEVIFAELSIFDHVWLGRTGKRWTCLKKCKATFTVRNTSARIFVAIALDNSISLSIYIL